MRTFVIQIIADIKLMIDCSINYPLPLSCVAFQGK